MEAILNACGENAKAYCCGPMRMLDAFERIVEGWPDARKHIERFTPPKLVDDTDAAPYTVVLARSGKEAIVEPNVGLVGTLEALGADVSVSCGGGVCGACRTTWLEGRRSIGTGSCRRRSAPRTSWSVWPDARVTSGAGSVGAAASPWA
jgi:vanillate O-demethylase ferredoxin subunit